uniref:Oxidoreductase n=1 Tax=Wuchereria bancrofti TaxID=6293 RepID=A0AAF5PI17_WUCBA
MAREKLHRQILISLKFALQYILCVLFRDLPRMIALKRKSITDQVVAITGGASGIGKGLAQKIALEQNAIVCILDINQEEGVRTVSQIIESGGRAYFFLCNVTKSDEVKLCARQIFSNTKIGCIDILVCNASILRIGKFLDLDDKDYQDTMNVNILGYIYTMRAFLPHMMDRNHGQIVAIGSICSHYGDYLGTAYCTAKFAIRGLMETLQMELYEEKKNGVVLTTIYPYFVDTTLISNNMTEPFSTFYDVIPLDKCVEEILDAILKERMYYFIPKSLAFLCNAAKCYTTKYSMPYVRRLINCRYQTLNKRGDSEIKTNVK